MHKLDCDQSLNFNDSINEESILYKSRMKTKDTNKLLINKYTDLERKFEEFQSEFAKTSKLNFNKESNAVNTTMKNSNSAKKVNKNMGYVSKNKKADLYVYFRVSNQLRKI